MKQFEVNMSTLVTVFKQIKQFVRPNTKYLITLVEWSERSLPANSVAHVWIKKISEYTGEDLKTTELRCKRDHGLPILLAGHHGETVAWMLDAANYYQMDDYSQLIFVSGMEVTRKFSTKEHNQYRNSIQYFWNYHGLGLDYQAKKGR